MSRFIDALRVDAPRPWFNLGGLDLDEASRLLGARKAQEDFPTLAGMTVEEVEAALADLRQASNRWPAYDGELLKLLRSATTIVADEVVGLDMEMGDEIPIAPPFDNLWVEVRVPRGGELEAVGWHLVTHDLNQAAAAARVRQMIGGDERLGEARWAVNVTWFIRRNGKNLGPVDTWLVDIDGEGRSRGIWRLTGLSWEQFYESDDRAFFKVLFETLALMNCKNVELESVEPPAKLSHAHERRHGVPLVRYRILSVAPFKAQVKTLEASGIHGRQQALHLIRGHFKTYTAERPLFGRITGTWYWPVHAAGKAALGRIDKDYRVKTVGYGTASPQAVTVR